VLLTDVLVDNAVMQLSWLTTGVSEWSKLVAHWRQRDQYTAGAAVWCHQCKLRLWHCSTDSGLLQQRCYVAAVYLPAHIQWVLPSRQQSTSFDHNSFHFTTAVVVVLCSQLSV